MSLHTPAGEVQTTTENISSSGVLFVVDLPLEMNSKVEFSMAIPAQVLGTETDVTVHCTGRVVRHEPAGSEPKAAAVVIDKYSFEA